MITIVMTFPEELNGLDVIACNKRVEKMIRAAGINEMTMTVASNKPLQTSGGNTGKTWTKVDWTDYDDAVIKKYKEGKMPSEILQELKNEGYVVKHITNQKISVRLTTLKDKGLIGERK